MYFIGVTKGKIENMKKEGKMRISILIFIYTIHFAYLMVYTKGSLTLAKLKFVNHPFFHLEATLT